MGKAARDREQDRKAQAQGSRGGEPATRKTARIPGTIRHRFQELSDVASFGGDGLPGEASSGVYFYRLETMDAAGTKTLSTKTRKMMLVK